MNGTGAHEQNFEGSEILLRAPGKSQSVIAINKKISFRRLSIFNETKECTLE